MARNNRQPETGNVDFRDLIDRIKEQTDILDVIGRRIELDRNHKAICPFHEEKDPSFSVNPGGQYFHCFGCGVGGDAISFLQLYERKSFMEALSELAAAAGISLPSITKEAKERIAEDRRIEDILTEAAGFYHGCLSEEARDYLADRGLTEETISRFQIGFARGGLTEYLIRECELPMSLCLKAGVLKEVERHGEMKVRDYFHKRIIFPTLKRGRVVHLTGRSLHGEEPRYLHLPGEMHFLYNEDDLSNEEALVVEGITDCLSLFQAGYPAVALIGCYLKPEHLPKFSRCKRIYVCLDGDAAGREGALGVAELIGERARIVELPEGLDPNDYFKGHSADEFAGLVDSAKDLIRYELDLIPPKTEKTELPRLLEPVLKQLARMDKAKREAYLDPVKDRFNLKARDLDGYREVINQFRKEEARAEKVGTSHAHAEATYSALFDGLVDIVEEDGRPAFLLQEGGKLSVATQVEREGVLYVPPPKENIPWLLPRAEEVLEFYECRMGRPAWKSDGDLYEELLNYHKEISELPSEEFYDLIVAWDLHTYLIEAAQYSPEICFFAIPERGKSRTGKGMIYVAYRGIHVESLREAYLLRVPRDLQASLFFDVRDIWQKAKDNGSDDILLHRFERGAKVPRVMYPDRGPHQDTVYYPVFGPTVISTNEAVHLILETRAISINMPETSRRFESDVTPEKSLPLKEQLVAFRAAHLGEDLPDISKPAKGRLGDILKPLLQMIHLVRPDREKSFLDVLKEIEKDRLAEKSGSLEAQILMTVAELEHKVEKGVLPIKDITDAFNEGKAEKSQITYQRVGRRLAAMGFKRARAGNNQGMLWDRRLIDQMFESYGLRGTHATREKPGHGRSGT
jgi:DNA primase catalytic core